MRKMRTLLSVSGLLFIFSVIGSVFWFNEWKYSLPTPVPNHYQSPNIGDYIDLGVSEDFKDTKPLFFHFFNPDCPCSKFNIPHFISLSTKYGNEINFAVIVMTNDKSYTEEKIRKKFDLKVPVLFDTSLAVACGVYSTPQAVLLGRGRMLYYKGNYNRSRYCTDPNSNYAQMAIDSLLAAHRQPLFNKYALTAYGCSLPTCTK